MMNLARADYIDYTLVLSTLQYLEKEENHIPWASAFNNLAYITRRLFAEDLTLLKVTFYLRYRLDKKEI